MNRENRKTLKERVEGAAEAALAAQGYVCAIDVLTGIGWLAHPHVKEWRTGQVDHLEARVQANPSSISDAMRSFEGWASGKGLIPSESAYLARARERTELRFSKSEDEARERAYRTHWVSPELSAKRRQRLAQKMSRPPELVVVAPRKADWKCHRCQGTSAFLILEPPGPACLRCARLDSLEFLPAGDAALSRLAKAKSEVHAVVVRFSRTRRRYERQGLLVEPKALREAERELRDPEPLR